MKKNVGIMGFGRIGRDALRIWALREDVNFEVTHVAVRNLDKTLKERTHLFKYDSIYRKFPGEIEFTDDGMIINGKKVTFVESKTPDRTGRTLVLMLLLIHLVPSRTKNKREVTLKVVQKKLS